MVSGFSAGTGHERLPNLDRRFEQGKPPRQILPEQRSGLEGLKKRLPDGEVDFDPLLGSPRWIRVIGGGLSGPKGEGKAISAESARKFAEKEPHRGLKGFLHEHRLLFGHGPEVLDNARVVRDYVWGPGRLHTVAWEQELDGIRVYDSILIAHTTAEGELWSLSSQFVAEPAQAADKGTPGRRNKQKDPPVSARQALAKAIQSIEETVGEGETIQLDGPLEGAKQQHRFKAGKLPGDAQASLVWLPLDGSHLRLCWEIEVSRRAQGQRFSVLVDAETSEVWVRRCLTWDLSEASYRVYAGESPSPFSPGHPVPSEVQPPIVPRELVTLSALNTNASPVGWIGDGDNETRGNNVDAHLDRDADDLPDLPRPQGTPWRVFDFPLDIQQSPTNYSQAAVVQLFYWCNWAHDKLYSLGFTEAAGNFQKDNFGRGGLGNDAVLADAQDGSGVNNANFTPARDGSPPRIQMFMFTGPNPARDADLDANVVLHEYVHGLTTRMVGNGAGFTQGEQPYGLGEGWSDFYALCLLSKPGDDPEAAYPAGAYSTYKLNELRKNYYFGIRRYPYCTDTNKNPLTLKHLYEDDVPEHPAVPRNPMVTSTGSESHRMGEVWCTMLWEMRANLIRQAGNPDGNQLALQLVTEALSLTPPNPNYRDARDAILTADDRHHQGTNHAAIWTAFAKRGLGFSARAWEAPLIGYEIWEAFDLPGAMLIQVTGGLTANGPVGGPFSPASAVLAMRNLGPQDLPWVLTASTNWLDISLTQGRLAGNSTTNILLSFNAAAQLLPKGTHTNILRFINQAANQVVTQMVVLRVDQAVVISGGMMQDKFNRDLDRYAYTFTPNGSNQTYDICRYPITVFPIEPTGGQEISLADDSYRLVSLTNGATVSIYNVRSNQFFIGSNGDVLFDVPPYFTSVTDPGFYTHYFHPGAEGFFEALRAAGLYADLNPGVGGKVSWKQLPDRAAITYENVPEFGVVNENSFQIELFTNGVIRYSYLGVAISDGIPYQLQIGFSRGQGAVDYQVTDLGSSPSCHGLELILPARAVEGETNATGTIRLGQPVGWVVTFYLLVNPSNAVLAGPVQIPAGQREMQFPISVPDDNLLNGTRSVTVLAQTEDYDQISSTMEITDNETATLTLNLPPNIQEGDGVLAGAGTVTMSSLAAAPITVLLSSSDRSVARVPPNVLIPTGQISAHFDFEIPDDSSIMPDRLVTIAASVENWTAASQTVTVADNESRQLVLGVPQRLAQTSSTHPSAGWVELGGTLPTNLAVLLVSAMPEALAVPESVVITAGSTRGYFDITVVDQLQTNDLAVNISASADAFIATNRFVLVGGVDSPSSPTAFYPADGQTRVGMTGTTLVWGTEEPEPSGSILFEIYFGTNSTPPLIGSTPGTNWALPKLAFSSTYYWRIIAQRGAFRVASPLWQFTTVRLSHFEISPVPSPQRFRTPFDITITARDEVMAVARDFEGTVAISGLASTPAGSIVISEVDIGNADQVEFANVSGQAQDISGWQVALYDWVSWPAPRVEYTIPGRVLCPAGDLFVLRRSSTQNFPGAYPTFLLGATLAWNDIALGNPIAVLLRDAAGNVVDFMCAADANPAQITNPVAIPPGEWLGIPLSATLAYNRSYQRRGQADRNIAGDWQIAVTNIGTRPTNMVLPFVGQKIVPVLPATVGSFTQGVWHGQVSVAEAASEISLQVEDAAGHRGTNAPFAVEIPDQLALQVNTPGATMRLGNAYDYRITISNSGPADATGVMLIDNLPAGLELVSITCPQGTCQVVGNQVVCQMNGPLSAEHTALVTLTVRPTLLGALTNQAWVLRAETYLPVSVETITYVEYPWITVNRTNVLESNTRWELLFPVLLSDPSLQPVSVDYWTVDGSARNGVDYIGTNGTLIFTPGQTNAVIPIPILGNLTAESNKFFNIYFDHATNAVIATSPALVTLINDEVFGDAGVTVFDAATVEGDDGVTNVVFTLTLSKPVGRTASIYYETVDGTAIAGLDYLAAAGRCIFPTGVQTSSVSITVLGDRLYESNETFTLKLTYADSAVMARSIATATIVDDDADQLHHFTWNVLSRTQFVNVPFTASLFAVDATGRVLSNYAGAVGLQIGRQQQTLNLGTGTNLWEYPCGGLYQDARLQVIYPANEIGRAGRITALALRVFDPPGQVLTNWTIRMKHTSLLSYQPGATWQDFIGPAAFQADMALPAGGWITFPLQHAFDYNGADSLLVDFSFDNSVSSSDGLCFASGTNDYRSMGFRTDSGFGAPLNWIGASIPTPILLPYYPNIRLTIDTALATSPGGGLMAADGTGGGNLNLVNGSWTGSLSLPGIGNDLFLLAHDNEGHTGSSSMQALAFTAALEQNGTQGRLRFPTVIGQRFQIEAADRLSSDAWAPISEWIPGTGLPYSFTNSILAPPNRFYRVRVTQN